MSALRAVAPASEPKADELTTTNVGTRCWSTEAVALFFGTSTDALYGGVKRGDFDDVVIRVGRRVVWPGPALARRIGLEVHGCPEKGGESQGA